MYYDYRIRSVGWPEQSYTGFTADLKQRVQDHNNGSNRSTAPYRPWRIVYYAAFEEKATALEFERYLKSGSGAAFARKRLWPSLLPAELRAVSIIHLRNPRLRNARLGAIFRQTLGPATPGA